MQTIRKSTTGKNMSLKSALAKSWVNTDRRVYIDKQLNEEMPFSQALDLDLVVLKATVAPASTYEAQQSLLNGVSPSFDQLSMKSGASSRMTRSAQDGFTR